MTPLQPLFGVHGLPLRVALFSLCIPDLLFCLVFEAQAPLVDQLHQQSDTSEAMASERKQIEASILILLLSQTLYHVLFSADT